MHIREEFRSARKWRQLVCPHGIRYYNPCSKCPYPFYGYNARFTIKDRIRLIRRGLR